MASRIDCLVKECKQRGIKVTFVELAKHAGVTYSTIQQIKRGEIKNPRIEVLRSIAGYFSAKLGRLVTIDDLLGDGSLDEIDQALHRAGAHPLEEEVVAVPILGEVPCGDLSLVGEEHIDGYYWVEKSMYRKGMFALRARGDSNKAAIYEWFRRPFVFAGCAVWNMHNHKQCPKRRAEWVITEEAHTPISTMEQAEAAYQRMQENKRKRP